MTQVADITARIKNVERRQHALGGAQHIGEGEALLVPVPRTQGDDGESAAEGMLEDPEHQESVGEPDERCDTMDSGALARLRIGEAEQLVLCQ